MATRINRVTLAAEMARREWRDNKLAALANVSRPTLSAIKGGKSVAPATAQRIADALNIPLEQLIEV